MEAHANLFIPSSPEDFSLQTKTVIDNYKENRLIFQELNHYKLHHEILGKHPVFDWFKKAQQIRSMKISDLFTMHLHLSEYIRKAKYSIRKTPHHRLTSSRLERIADYEKQVKEILRLINP